MLETNSSSFICTVKLIAGICILLPGREQLGVLMAFPYALGMLMWGVFMVPSHLLIELIFALNVGLGQLVALPRTAQSLTPAPAFPLNTKKGPRGDLFHLYRFAQSVRQNLEFHAAVLLVLVLVQYTPSTSGLSCCSHNPQPRGAGLGCRRHHVVQQLCARR